MLNDSSAADGNDGVQRTILTIQELNEEIAAAMDQGFPRPLWVRGEIQRLPADAARRKHVYFELHETRGSGAAEYQISAQIMDWDRRRFGLGRFLDGSDPDLQLANQLEVCLQVRVNFYAPFGKLSLSVVGVDKHFALGRLEARRRQILADLEKAGLLDLNAAVPLPDLPLDVGLITSPGSAAERDFMSGIEGSPWAFRVTLIAARMQGERVQDEVIAGLMRHIKKGVQLIVITRGGGSKADLSWFDQKDLAEAIATCPVPVITAIGHQIDHSIADLVAHHSCKTPTAAAEFLTGRIKAASDRLEVAAAQLADLVLELLERRRQQLDRCGVLVRLAGSVLLQARLQLQVVAGRLQQALGGRLNQAGEGLTGQTARLDRAAIGLMSRDRARVSLLAQGIRSGAQALLEQGLRAGQDWRDRLTRSCGRAIVGRQRQLDGLATQARLLDPVLILARGFTITSGAAGKAILATGELKAGDRLTTRFADGSVASVVSSVSSWAKGSPEMTSQKRRTRKKGKVSDRGEENEDPGQESLF